MARIVWKFDERFGMQKLRQLLVLVLASIVRQQWFWNYGQEEMRGDSPQHACLRLTLVQYSVLYEYFYWKKKNK